MRNKKLARAFPVQANCYLRDTRHRARFSELLNPAETETHIAATFHDLAHQGWAIRVEVTSEELELLEPDGRDRHMQLDLVHFSPGLPIAVLQTVVEGMEFRFGIPLWNIGAQEWLLDAIDRQQFMLLLDPPDDDSGIVLVGFGSLSVNPLSLISAAALTRELGTEESHYQSVLAGLKLMQGRPAVAPLPGSRPFAVRVAIAGQGKGALAVMGALMATETVRVATIGRDNYGTFEGQVGPGPRD